MMSVREVLNCLSEEGVVSDLKEGENGAPKLSEEQLEQLNSFKQIATPDRSV